MQQLARRVIIAEELGLEYPEEAACWDIQTIGDGVYFFTWMDNFDMHEFLEKIGVPEEAFKDEWHSNGPFE